MNFKNIGKFIGPILIATALIMTELDMAIADILTAGGSGLAFSLYAYIFPYTTFRQKEDSENIREILAHIRTTTGISDSALKNYLNL